MLTGERLPPDDGMAADATEPVRDRVKAPDRSGPTRSQEDRPTKTVPGALVVVMSGAWSIRAIRPRA